MLTTTLLAQVAAGLLTALEIDDGSVKVAAILGFLGASIGIGLRGPSNAAQTVLTPKEVLIGLSVMIFGAGRGLSLFLSTSSALFPNRLVDEIQKYYPATKDTEMKHVGLSEICKIIGSDRLKDILLGYDEAVTQTFYLPVALTFATIVRSSLTEWRSVKKKQS